MTPGNSSAPALASEGREQLVASRHDSTRLIGYTVDADLDATLWRLVAGDLTLSDLTPALRDWWAVAAEFGRTTANTDRIDRLTYERDLWYACYANGWTPGEYMRRHTDTLWDQAVAA